MRTGRCGCHSDIESPGVRANSMACNTHTQTSNESGNRKVEQDEGGSAVPGSRSDCCIRGRLRVAFTDKALSEQGLARGEGGYIYGHLGEGYSRQMEQPSQRL